MANQKKNKKRQERLRQKKHHAKFMSSGLRFPPYEKLSVRNISPEEFVAHGGVLARKEA